MNDYYKTVRAQLFKEERRLLKTLAEQAVKRFGSAITIVNIGVLYGGSLHCLRAGAPNATLVGIDIDCGKMFESVNPGALLLEGDSAELHKYVVSPIHVLFVDGSHEEEQVTKDTEGWTPKVVPGGVAAFHDARSRRFDGPAAAVLRWLSRQDSWQQIHEVRSTLVYERK